MLQFRRRIKVEDGGDGVKRPQTPTSLNIIHLPPILLTNVVCRVLTLFSVVQRLSLTWSRLAFLKAHKSNGTDTVLQLNSSEADAPLA
eukprot:6475636-Amphidinium_carterae.1